MRFLPALSVSGHTQIVTGFWSRPGWDDRHRLFCVDTSPTVTRGTKRRPRPTIVDNTTWSLSGNRRHQLRVRLSSQLPLNLRQYEYADD